MKTHKISSPQGWKLWDDVSHWQTLIVDPFPTVDRCSVHFYSNHCKIRWPFSQFCIQCIYVGACSHLIIFMSLQINLEKNNFIRKTSVIVLRHIVIIISNHICSRCHNYANNTKKIKFLIHTLSFCLFLRGWTSSFSDNAVHFRPPVTGQPNFSLRIFTVLCDVSGTRMFFILVRRDILQHFCWKTHYKSTAK